MDLKREAAIADEYPQAAAVMPNLAKQQKEKTLKRRFSLLDPQSDASERMKLAAEIGNSPVKRTLSPSIAVSKTPLQRPFVNSSILAKHRGSLSSESSGNTLKVPSGSPPDVIIISDDDASGSTGSLNQIPQDLTSSTNIPEPNVL